MTAGRVDLRRSPAGRRLLFAALYFLEGAPIGYVWWALPVALARAGVGPERIGAVVDRLGRRRVVAAGGLATAVATASLALAAPGGCTWVALGAVYLGAGLLTASSYALLMDLTDPRLGSAQFSAYMGATNLCEAWSSAMGGRLAASRGWPVAFAAAAALGLAALPLLVLLPPPKRELPG